MGLTVAEKTHWRDRIEAKINRRIEVILAGDPGLMDRIKHAARGRALTSLGLAEFQSELDQIAAQKEALARRERCAQRAMLARVRGVEIDQIEEVYYGRHETEVTKTVSQRQAVHEDELLAEHEIGRQILQLRAEKDRSARYGLARVLTGPDPPALDQGRRVARRRADPARARGVGDPAGRRGGG